MPNWVRNTLTISGDADAVARVVEQVGAPYEKLLTHYERGEDGAVRLVEEVGKVEMPFSFWNITRPSDDIMGDYNTPANGSAPENNWYAWNNTNWGTKWDACEVEVVDNIPGNFVVRFETAWSPPYPVIADLAAQHPGVSVWLEWEEEQGFGAEVDFSEGEPVEVRAWDIPDSHADFVDRDNEDGCVCSWNDDEDDWYSDCPRGGGAPDPEVAQDIIEMAEVG